MNRRLRTVAVSVHPSGTGMVAYVDQGGMLKPMGFAVPCNPRIPGRAQAALTVLARDIQRRWGTALAWRWVDV